jgi:hypothetical protein
MLDCRVEFPSDLLDRFEKLMNAFDFGYAYLNREMGTLTSGMEFGDLALI